MAVMACSSVRWFQRSSRSPRCRIKNFKGKISAASSAALHLVHAVDAPGLFRVDDVHRRRAAPPHLRIGKERHMHGKRLHGIGAEPVGNFFHMGAVGVIEMLSRGEDLNCLRSALG